MPDGLLKMNGTGHYRSQAIGSHKSITSQWVRKTSGSGQAGALCAVIEVKHLPVKDIGSGTGPKDGFDIGNGGCFKLRARQNHLGGNGQEKSQAFRVDKEEQLIFPDGSTQGPCPLIGIYVRSRRP